MTTRNPFPGMNPYFEQRWMDAHTRLITYICEALQVQLPADLIAGAEERLVTIGGGTKPRPHRPDVGVTQPWELKEEATASKPRRVRAPAATAPTFVSMEQPIERWVEIRCADGRLVTVIALLSPSNKLDEPARAVFRERRGTMLAGGVNVVEIDLIRQGCSVFPLEMRLMAKEQKAPYGVCVFRQVEPSEREAYLIGLRQPLPILSIPLRSADAEAALELQPLIDQCHERGRYHLLRYKLPLEPPLDGEDANWLDQILRSHGLR